MSDAIMLEQCRSCGHHWVLARRRCPRCGAAEIELIPASGGGRVYAATLVHRAPDDAFAAIAPYRIALIDLDEGPRLMAHLDDEAPVGTWVTGRLETIAGRRIPVFARAGYAGEGEDT